ncbi:MAG TPA: SPOR domain-containing protein, partial [Longimicrobiaceae bacterium]|nr:SPOR domain-containing protein [Longimicrobiaceae bacterium]
PRRLSRMATWFLGLLALCVVLVLVQFAARDRGGPAAPQGPPRVVWRGTAAMQQVARDEAERAGRVLGEGDTGWIVVLASFPAARHGEAAAARDRLQSRGYRAGLGNSLVYPELRDGFVALLAGPYRERGEAEGLLPELREQVAADAFLKRVTFRAP